MSKQSILKTLILASCLLATASGGICWASALRTSRQAVVVFHEHVDWQQVRSFADDWGRRGVAVVMDLPMINSLVVQAADPAELRDMGADARVLRIEEDQRMEWKGVGSRHGRSFIEGVPGLEKEKYPWSILKLYGHPYYDMLEGLNKKLISGVTQFALDNLGSHKKIRIAIFDTGIKRQRKSFEKVIEGGIDLIHPVVSNSGKKKGRELAAEDDNGHGSHVSGIVTAALDKGYKWGEKAKIELFSVKVLDENATGDVSSIVMALQWAIDNDIDIVNMSIGYRQDSLALRLAVQAAHRAGLVLIASAGNHSNYDDTVVLRGLADGGAGDGGAGDGGAGDGGAGDGGAGDGGAGDGGAGDGGAGDGGAGDGGAGDGGAGDGGAGDGGAGDGGAGDGGAGDGGAGDGGAGDGGAGDGGAGDGGAGDGGAGDGGAGGMNAGTPLPLYATMYPARYPEVIAVAASGMDGYLAAFSNFDEHVDLMAPGANVVSADITNGDWKKGYGSCSGTSMAAPHVTAAVALMLALDPTLSNDDIQRILVDTADYNLEENIGELDLHMVLSEVLFGFFGSRYSTDDEKELKKFYKEQLKEKIAAADERR